MIGAVCAEGDSNATASGSDLADSTIMQHLDAVEDNATEKSISDEGKLKSENDLKTEEGADNILKNSGTTTVNNWGELGSAINDGAVIELDGDDVYYAEGSGIAIDSGTVEIDGKGHTIDAQRLNSHIFEINNGATLKLENLILKNTLTNSDGGAIYSSGTLIVTNCTFTNNTATKERGAAIYNHEGTLKIVNSRFEKNSIYEKAIYNYCEDEDNPFRLTIINATMIEDKVCVNFDDKERRLDDKRDIDLLTTEVNAYIQEIIYNGNPVFIGVSGIDEDFTGSITVNITNTIYNTVVSVANGEGNTTMDLDINRYTARFKNFISLTEEAFERDDTKPYLEINFKVTSNNSFSALEDIISKSTDKVTLNQDYLYDSKTDSAYIRIVDRTLTIYGNGHSINGNTNNGDTLFLIEDDSNVRMENITLENGHAQSRSHLGEQIRMGGAIFVSRSTLILINSTLKNNKAEGGSGGAIYSEFSTLNIIESNFTNNSAANGKNLYVQGGNGVYILNSGIDEKDIYNEPDWDNDDKLARITILNDLNATLYISDHFQGSETLFDITQPENLNAVASLTVNNDSKGNIQITGGQASADLNLDVGSYIATITTPDIVYYTDSGRNLTCTYLSAATTSNEFKVRHVPKTYIVNNSNVGEIFNGTDDTLSDFINECDILDFQGTIDRNRYLVINKPVNIISSTKNAVINLHTVIGDSESGVPKFSFIINEGASGSNISDLYINNTQTWIYNVDGLYLKNIIISVRSASGLGAEIGHTAIRYCNDITLDNCSIFTENTQASCLVVYVTSNFAFINSKIEGQGKIGSLITLECPNEVYDAPYDDYLLACTNNTIKNSVIKTGCPDADPIKNENADHTTIDGVNVYASKNINPGQYATVMNSNFYNASGIDLGSYSKAYNNTVDGSSSNVQNGAIVYNNTFKDLKISNPDVTFVMNTVTNKLTISSPSNIYNNVLNLIELILNSRYSNITNNTISGKITVDVVNVTIKYNTINTENDYAVVVKKKGAVVTNNVIYAKTKFGNNAVDRYQDSTVVADNIPKPSLALLQSQINKATSNITLGQDFGYDHSIGDVDEGIIINKDLKIIGNGYTIDGMDQARIFQITNGANVIIENVTFINGKAHGEDYNGNHDVGGAIAVKLHSNLTLIDCVFTNNHADQNGWGGAIFITGNSTLSIITSNFTDSYAQDAGNVIYALDGNYVHILECNVDGINFGDIDISDMGDYIGNDDDDMGLLAPIKIFKTPDLIANIFNYTEGENAQIIITEPSNFSGRASLIVNDKTVSDIQFNDDGTASAQLDVAPGKVYCATLTNDYFEYARDISLNIACLYVPTTTVTNSFKVMKKPNIQFDVQNITFNQTQTIKATINGTGNVTIKLNGTTILDNIFINKTVNCTVGDLNAGNYAIELNYSGDEFTIPGMAAFSFTVFKANSSLKINDIVFDYGGKGSTPFSYDNASGVHAEIVNHPNASVNVTGNVIYVSNLNAGKYTLSVTTITDANHNNVTKTSAITVNVLKTQFTAIAVTATYNINKNLIITLKDGRNNAMNGVKVSVNINGAKTYTTDKNGQVKINVASLVPKAYTAKISFAGNAKYKASTKSVKVTVKKDNTKLIASSKSFTVKATKKVTAILKDSKNRIIKNRYVTFKVAGKTYKVKTDSKGVATATVKITKKGSFKTTAAFAGDAYYNKAATKTIKITVR